MLLLNLLLLAIECELFRRLVMHSRGKFVAMKAQEVFAVAQAVAGGQPAKDFCQSCLVRQQKERPRARAKAREKREERREKREEKITEKRRERRKERTKERTQCRKKRRQEVLPRELSPKRDTFLTLPRSRRYRGPSTARTVTGVWRSLTTSACGPLAVSRVATTAPLSSSVPCSLSTGSSRTISCSNVRQRRREREKERTKERSERKEREREKERTRMRAKKKIKKRRSDTYSFSFLLCQRSLWATRQ
jgi:hypothetical protein